MISLIKKIWKLVNEKNIWVTVCCYISFVPCAIFANFLGTVLLGLPQEHILFGLIFIAFVTIPILLFFFSFSNLFKWKSIQKLIRFIALGGIIMAWIYVVMNVTILFVEKMF